MPMLSQETRSNDNVYYGRVSEQGLGYLDYALTGTDLTKTYEREVYTQAGITVTDYLRAGTSASMQVDAQAAGEISLPFFGFEGFAAELGGHPLSVFAGENNRLTVSVPANTQGTLRVWFAGKAYWRVADGISLLTLLLLCLRPVLHRRWEKRKSAS